MTERHADSERIDVYIAEIRAREMRVCVDVDPATADEPPFSPSGWPRLSLALLQVTQFAQALF